MSRRARRRLVAFAAVAVLVVGYLVWEYAHKPLFLTRFGFHPDQVAPPQWLLVHGPQRDRRGNVLLFDELENVVLVEVAGGSMDAFYPAQAHHMLVFTLANGTQVRVHAHHDRLYIVNLKTGQITARSIAKGAAARLVAQENEDHPDDAFATLKNAGIFVGT